MYILEQFGGGRRKYFTNLLGFGNDKCSLCHCRVGIFDTSCLYDRFNRPISDHVIDQAACVISGKLGHYSWGGQGELFDQCRCGYTKTTYLFQALIRPFLSYPMTEIFYWSGGTKTIRFISAAGGGHVFDEEFHNDDMSIPQNRCAQSWS